ncbi:hypothetical protein HDV02_005956 [Globomyces sp. JEL0801]|nr:hypothetical protein HDV02_005956 [Globomyces sp. JEL0801]
MQKQSNPKSQSINLTKFDSRLEQYPLPLNFYTISPIQQVTLQEFETFALDRLKVLLAIDSSKLRTKNDVDMGNLIEPIMIKYLDLKRNDSINLIGANQLFQQRYKDHLSHFILRLAYCKTPELQQWFIKHETLLFKLRYQKLTKPEKDQFFELKKLAFNELSLDQLIDFYCQSLNDKSTVTKQKCLQDIRSIYGDQKSFIKVEFEKVIDLVSKRNILLINGFGILSTTDRLVLLLQQFKDQLQIALNDTLKVLPRLDEEDRILPIVESLAKQSLSKEYHAFDNQSQDIKAEDIKALSAHFPPCMNNLYSKLLTDSHLKHTGRIHFGLFLKGIGLSLDEALIFWRRSFNKMNDDEFNKKGMEGKRTNYTPYSCLKVIQSIPGPGETHGCPFRQFSQENLSDMLQNLNLEPQAVQEVSQKAKDGHYQLACTRLFELTRAKALDPNLVQKEQSTDALVKNSDGSFMLMEPIGHPNQWFDISLYGNNSQRNFKSGLKSEVKEE